VFFAEDVPSKGYKTFVLSEQKNTKPYSEPAQKDNKSLNNKFYDIKFDGDGNITEIYDKINSRQVLKANERANVLQAFEDKPLDYDAWDINIYYQEKAV
jgi:alpha-mannosidase